MGSHDADHRLIAQAQQHAAGFGLFYERYVDEIYRFVYQVVRTRELAEDLTSATFESALKGLRTYTDHGYSPGAWLRKIALNQLRRHYRTQRVLHALHLRMAGAPHGSNAHDEGHPALAPFLSRLSTTDQRILHLKYFRDLTPAEASYILGCSTGTFYVKLHRALARLEKLLRQERHHAP